jgi:hypothetical protein
MSEFIATESAEPKSSGKAPDLQLHLYREIGISALVATLHVMAKPVASNNDAASDERCIPTPVILQSDGLAA